MWRRQKQQCARAVIFFGVVLGAWSPGAARELRVVAATNDLGAIAEAVGSAHLTIDVVARPDRDPHALAVRPSTLRKTRRADCYLAVGMSLDAWSADIVRGSRNRHVRLIDCSEPIDPLEVPEAPVTPAMGDVHPEGNPHYWLDPVNGQRLAHFLAAEFGALDPEHAPDFQANAQSFADTLESRLAEWRRALAGRAIVEYHRSWIYLAERFDVQIVGQVEPLPGIPPTARQLAGLAEVIATERAAIVVREPYHPKAPVEFLERETGIQAAVLRSSCAEPTAAAYIAHFDEIALVLGGHRSR